MQVPDDVSYSPDHEWARLEGTSIRIGLTDYAQDALGDVVFVQVPSIGTTVGRGTSFSEVESTKSVSDIFAPVSGTVIEVNSDLVDHPEVLNTDPYGAGWLCVIEMSDPAEFTLLMNASAYRKLTEE